MPSRADPRRLIKRRQDTQEKDERVDNAVPLDTVWADEAKRKRRRPRTGETLETGIRVLQALQNIHDLWP